MSLELRLIKKNRFDDQSEKLKFQEKILEMMTDKTARKAVVLAFEMKGKIDCPILLKIFFPPVNYFIKKSLM